MPPPPAAPRADRRTAIGAAALLAIAIVAAYARTFHVPLLLDDILAIADNPSIRHLWPLGPVLHPPDYAGDGGRPLINLSYALNYAAGGASVAGYHAVNLAIHVLASWVLFGLVRRTLRKPRLADRFGPAATPLALGIAALWALHPAQTEAVTYLTQRCEALMGLFYLFTLYAFVRGAESEHPPGLEAASRLAAEPKPSSQRGEAPSRRFRTAGWFILAFAACLAGVFTKEVIATAPLLVWLYDRTFLSGSFRNAWRRHRLLYCALFATWLPLAALMAGLRHRGVGFGQGVPAWAYALTEARAVMIYLKLAVWPSPLVFDYGMYRPAPVASLVPFVLALLALLVFSAWALARRPAAGFAAGWFFVILAPTSSLIPLAGQPVADHRLYLPLAAVVALAVLAGYAWLRRGAYVAMVAAAALFALLTAERNHVYRSAEAIWRATVAACPENPRAHNNLGAILAKEPGSQPAAMAQFEEALRLKPDYAEARDNLGVVLAALPGRRGAAIAELRQAIAEKPDDAAAHNDLGAVLSQDPSELGAAAAQLQEAIRLRPDYAEAYNHLGNVLLQLPGGAEEALADFRTAIRLEPDYADAHFDLGNALSRLPGREEEGIGELRKAIALKPGDAEARYNLAVVLGRMPGRLDEAIGEYQAAIRLQPGFAAAHNNLGNAWLRSPGHVAEAIAEFRQTLRLEPDHATARFNLAIALLATPGGAPEAQSQLEAYLRLRPNDPRAEALLARLRSRFP